MINHIAHENKYKFFHKGFMLWVYEYDIMVSKINNSYEYTEIE